MPRNKPDDPFTDDDWGREMPDGPDSPDSREMPDSTGGERPDFIKPQHVGKVGTTGTLELVRVTSETSDYSDVILLVNFRKVNFRLGLRTFSKEYKSLRDKFGGKPADWHGTLRFKVLDNSGKPYVSVRA